MTGYAIVLASPELERIQAVSTIASIAASSDIPVEVFVTMNALTAFESETVAEESFETEGAVGEAMLASDEVPLFVEQFEQAASIGPLTVYACEMAMDLLRLETDDLSDVFVDTLGVAGFLNSAQDKQVVFV
ncbi:DsrE/DsrF/DrsH-like family protein [Halococcoides cellulosivorans]|uniref:Peroxiredoxin family protein n=1 Tax=Halococcoides cellulosivorans TaxID=1679096 RepID=A0A2R4WY48_9EURY|nr:DsrE/DsrF/DrsH-like family protein [Halococcoides cellulosivorans]AWB26463.1 hypothetical protein HARCEL1_01390 [Halococcoides cellulosivorans]